MKFYVTRTSIWENEKPFEDSRVQFDGEKDAWYIELNTLKELIDFADNTNEEIILTSLTAHGEKTPSRAIEIYDTWRE